MYKITTYYYEDEEKIAEVYSQSHRLWAEHLCYTRNAIISLLTGAKDIEAISERLMTNQDDIAELLYPFHDRNDVDAYAAVLKQHIALAVELIKAIKAGDDLAEPTKAWYDNGDTMLTWMENENPYYWSRVVTVPLWNDHLKYTIDEVTNRLKEDWTADIDSLDNNRHCMHKWADLYATGIVYNHMELFSKKKTKDPHKRLEPKPHEHKTYEPKTHLPVVVTPPKE